MNFSNFGIKYIHFKFSIEILGSSPVKTLDVEQ